MGDYNRLAEDLSAYLSAKLPEVDIATRMELSEYISNRVTRYLQDALWERDKEWKKAIRHEKRQPGARPKPEDGERREGE